MELKDTTLLMNSPDYKDRFLAEYYQAKIRYKKLHDLLVKFEEDKLDFETDSPIELLHEQLHAMKRYIAILENRMEFEDIEVERRFKVLTLTKNTVVQFNEYHEWCGCLGIIEEIKGERIMVGVPVPNKGTAYIYCIKEDIEAIGIAELVREK